MYRASGGVGGQPMSFTATKCVLWHYLSLEGYAPCEVWVRLYNGRPWL